MTFEYTFAQQTHYNGRHFRSRLEARWAVFFDSLGIQYHYEPDGFALPSGEKYQPDFLLPAVYLRRGKPGLYVEVKPTVEAIHASHLTLSEFGSGYRDFRYPPDPYTIPQLEDPHPGAHNLVVLVGNVTSHAAYGEFGHFQYGPWWDDNMGFQRCGVCAAHKVDFIGGSYDDCPRCGEKDASTPYHPALKDAEEAALSMRFDRQGRAQT